MKLLFILGCLLMTVTAMAQKPRSTTKSISDDGVTLKLKYEVPDKSINYANEFDVKGWSKDQKERLVNRIIDSLNNNGGSSTQYVNRHIHDDGKTMTVTIDANKNGQQISFNKSYDVKGLTKQQKDAIIEDLLKGLGLSSKQ